MKRKSIPYYGEIPCEAINMLTGKPCPNKAYYQLVNDSFVCGQHSIKSKDSRKQLVTMNTEYKKTLRHKSIEAHKKSVEEAATENRKQGKRGHLTCEKLKMMRDPKLHPGVLNVFPNFKHQNRKDGFGCSSLSPKSMGPVDHKQPGLPFAQTIENLHQGNKVFPFMLLADGKTPSDTFYAVRKAMYEDKTPWRHQHDFLKAHPNLLPSLPIDLSKKLNAPAFSVWVSPIDSKEHHFTYVESRQFYCHFYENMVKDLPDFKELERKLEQGYSLNIVGYDGYQPDKSLEEHYLDPSRPFGHELVLYSCLMKEYPWRKYKNSSVW